MSNSAPIHDLRKHFEDYITTLNAATPETISTLLRYIDPETTLCNGKKQPLEEYGRFNCDELIICTTEINAFNEDGVGIIKARMDNRGGNAWNGEASEEMEYKWNFSNGKLISVVGGYV